MSLADIPLIVKHCRTKGPVAMSALNSQELQLLQNMVSRLSRLAETAAAVRLLSRDRERVTEREYSCVHSRI